MNLILKIVNNPKEAINSPSHEFQEEGGTIGREHDCSWVLNDKSGVVSRIHLEVVYKSGSYFLIDLSSNGTLYKRENRRIPPRELVAFNESEVLTLGPYEILVGFVQGEKAENSIDDFLNQREIDVALQEKMLLKKEGDSALDLILKDKVEEKDILEFANIAPKEELSDNNFSLADAFEDVENNSAYTTHIRPPTFEEKIVEDPMVNNKTDDGLLLTVFTSKLGLNLNALSTKQQVVVVNELAQTLLVAMEETEALKDNALAIVQKLEKPHLKVAVSNSKDSKRVNTQKKLQQLLYQNSSITLSETLSANMQELREHQTTLYEASKEHNDTLQHAFAPNTLEHNFRPTSFMAKLVAKDALTWRGYVATYHHLNDEGGGAKSFQAQLFEKYQAIKERFNLAKG